MRNPSGNNPFFALTAIESEDDEEVNVFEAVQEIVEISVDLGAAKSVWPSRKKGVVHQLRVRVATATQRKRRVRAAVAAQRG